MTDSGFERYRSDQSLLEASLRSSLRVISFNRDHFFTKIHSQCISDVQGSEQIQASIG